MPKLSDDQFLAAIEQQEGIAEQLGEVSEERVEAVRYYLGENVNPAPEGRSQVVSRDIYDLAESIKPNLLRPFLSGEKVVEFVPRGPEDIQAAEQETAYINHIVQQKNNAFAILHDWSHDGLISKNGYALCEWHESEDLTVEKYAGLSEEELTILAQDKEVEIAESEAYADLYGNVQFNVTLKRAVPYGCVKIRIIPPERIYVDAKHDQVSLATANFCEWRERTTIGDLRLAGFNVPDDINDGGSASTLDYESDMRDRDNPWRDRDEGSEPDPSMRKVTVRTGWIRCDYDGKGKPSLKRFVVVGKTFLDIDDADMIPIAAFAPFPLPHQHYGLSLYDIAHDLQDVKTALQRGVLDATYLGAAPRFAIDSSRVNLDDMLVSRPGGIVRVEGGPGDAIFPLSSVPSQNTTLPVIEYIDSVRETRTGITRYNQGLDANSLNKTATGVNMIMNASQMRMELIARQFAEAVRELFSIVHALTLKHARKSELVRLNNEYVPVDPRQWVKRNDLSIAVGLGNGNRMEQQAFLMQMLQIAMGPALAMGLTEPPKLYAMLSKLANNAGFKSADEFWSDPSKKPPAPPAPPPPEVLKMQAEQQKAQAQMQMDAQKLQMDAQRTQADMQMEAQKMASQRELEAQKLAMQAEVERQKLAMQAQIEQQRMALEQQKLAMQARNERLKLIQAEREARRRHAVDRLGKIMNARARAQNGVPPTNRGGQ